MAERVMPFSSQCKANSGQTGEGRNIVACEVNGPVLDNDEPSVRLIGIQTVKHKVNRNGPVRSVGAMPVGAVISIKRKESPLDLKNEDQPFSQFVEDHMPRRTNTLAANHDVSHNIGRSVGDSVEVRVPT